MRKDIPLRLTLGCLVVWGGIAACVSGGGGDSDDSDLGSTSKAVESDPTLIPYPLPKPTSTMEAIPMDLLARVEDAFQAGRCPSPADVSEIGGFSNYDLKGNPQTGESCPGLDQ